jgi:hypothetical protein
MKIKQPNQKRVYRLVHRFLMNYFQISFLAVVRKAQLFKVHSNRFLQENLTVTKYVKEPFFEDK